MNVQKYSVHVIRVMLYFHQGTQMDSGCSMEDYVVLVGPEECSMAHLDSSALYCIVPASEPTDVGSPQPGVSRVQV